MTERKGRGYTKNPLTHFGNEFSRFRARNNMSGMDLVREGVTTNKERQTLIFMSRDKQTIKSWSLNHPEEFHHMINTLAEIDAKQGNRTLDQDSYDSYQSQYQEAVFKDIGDRCMINLQQSAPQSEPKL